MHMVSIIWKSCCCWVERVTHDLMIMMAVWQWHAVRRSAASGAFCENRREFALLEIGVSVSLQGSLEAVTKGSKIILLHLQGQIIVPYQMCNANVGPCGTIVCVYRCRWATLALRCCKPLFARMCAHRCDGLAVPGGRRVP